MRIYLQTPSNEEQAPRYYQLMLQEDMLGGWTLVKQWGFQGASGTMQREHYTTYDEALEAMMRSRETQIKRGYKVMFFQGEGVPQ